MECLVFKTVQSFPFSDKFIQKIVYTSLRHIKKQGNVSVHLVGDKKIKSLNFTYRGKNSITDVLSFAISDGTHIPGSTAEIGDIFMSIPQIRRQARGLKIPFKEELTRMLIHGVLHLSGFDHLKKKEAQVMFNIQEEMVNFIV